MTVSSLSPPTTLIVSRPVGQKALGRAEKGQPVEARGCEQPPEDILDEERGADHHGDEGDRRRLETLERSSSRCSVDAMCASLRGRC